MDHHLLAAVGVARDAVEGARRGCPQSVDPQDLHRALDVLGAAGAELERHAISNSALHAALRGATGESPPSDHELAEISAALGRLLRSAQIAGRPRPADADWTFGPDDHRVYSASGSRT